MEEGKREGKPRQEDWRKHKHTEAEEMRPNKWVFDMKKERKAIHCHTALQIKGISSLILAIPLKKFQILQYFSLELSNPWTEANRSRGEAAPATLDANCGSQEDNRCWLLCSTLPAIPNPLKQMSNWS